MKIMLLKKTKTTLKMVIPWKVYYYAGKWITLFVKSTQAGNTSNMALGIVEVGNQLWKVLESNIPLLTYSSFNESGMSLVSTWNVTGNKIRIKSITFDTTYLVDDSIEFLCNKDSTYCIGCNLKTFVYIPLNDSLQFDSCIEGCGDLCFECGTNEIDCIKCQFTDGVDLFKGALCNCKPGYYYNDTSNSCDACAPSCASCVASSEHCSSCKEDFLLKNDSCICKPNTYFNLGKCLGCNPMCMECSSWEINSCTLCYEGFHYNNNTHTCISQDIWNLRAYSVVLISLCLLILIALTIITTLLIKRFVLTFSRPEIPRLNSYKPDKNVIANNNAN